MSLLVKDGAGVTRRVSSDTDGDATYRACASDVAPGATPADFIIVKGSATKIVRIKRIRLGGFSTAAGSMAVTAVRRTADCTGGTPVAVTCAQHDASQAGATATVRHFTAANTAGAGTTVLAAARHGTGPLTANIPDTILLDCGARGDQPIVLRGASEFLAVSYAGAALTAGAKFDYEIQFTESDS